MDVDVVDGHAVMQLHHQSRMLCERSGVLAIRELLNVVA